MVFKLKKNQEFIILFFLISTFSCSCQKQIEEYSVVFFRTLYYLYCFKFFCFLEFFKPLLKYFCLILLIFNLNISSSGFFDTKQFIFSFLYILFCPLSVTSSLPCTSWFFYIFFIYSFSFCFLLFYYFSFFLRFLSAQFKNWKKKFV